MTKLGNRIHINYDALRQAQQEDQQLGEELLRKAKGMFGAEARRELVRILDPHIRLQAMQVAKRQLHPQLLCNAGREGLFEALKVYPLGESEIPFRSYATPFIRQAMEAAKARLMPLPPIA